MGSAHKLAELSYADVERLLGQGEPSVALIPSGSIEAHGPHLPLGTDTLISEANAVMAAHKLAALGYVAVCFPAIPYGVTEWARAFAGTVSLTPSVVEELVVQTAKAALDIGFDRVVLTNAHLEPAHIATLRAAAQRVAAETGRELLFVDKTRRALAARLTAEFHSGSCHAGQYETSLVLAIRGDLVDTECARSLPEHKVALHEKIATGAQSFRDCGLDNAYCGAPALATAAEGKSSLEVLSDMVVERVAESFAGR